MMREDYQASQFLKILSLLFTLIVKGAAGLLIVDPKDAIFQHECDPAKSQNHSSSVE